MAISLHKLSNCINTYCTIQDLINKSGCTRSEAIDLIMEEQQEYRVLSKSVLNDLFKEGKKRVLQLSDIEKAVNIPASSIDQINKISKNYIKKAAS